MAGEFTLPGVLLSGVHASRPAASAVANGCLYNETDTGKIYQSDGVSTWTQWGPTAGGGFANPMTTEGDLIYGGSSGTPTRIAVGASGKMLTSNGTDPVWGNGPMTAANDLIIGGASGVPTRLATVASKALVTDGSGNISWGTGGGGGGALAAHPLPLDAYAIDGTYGDDCTGAALSGIWTRRNFTSGAETYQYGPESTWLKILTASRGAGDGYYQTAPAGDWTFAMAYRIDSTGYAQHWGLQVVDVNGTGVGFAIYQGAPNAPLMQGVTTYTTSSGTYYEPWYGSSGSPNAAMPVQLFRKMWLYLRKSGTNYYCAYSLDGETWSAEGGPIAWAGTVNRVAMGMIALGSTGVVTNEYVLVDWFNKIA